jgi:hypothetical protein
MFKFVVGLEVIIAFSFFALAGHTAYSAEESVPLPTATPASSPTQDIWIAVRTDGLPGSGTQADPFDGSTPEKLDTILHNYYWTFNLGVHLMGAGPFRTYANHIWHVRPGWVISGDGMDRTTIQMVGNVAGMRDDVDVFTSDSNVVTDNATIKDITVDCNWAELALTADEGLGARAVTDGVIILNSPVITSSTAVFTNEDYAKTLTGVGIPAGTIILSIQDAQHATMSANATTTGAGVSVLIGGEKNIKTGAIILWGSNNLVDNVRCINSYGSLANNMEVFVIEMAAPRSENGTNNVVQYCRVEHPQGNHGAPFALFGWPDLPTYLITDSRVINCTAIGNAGGLSWSNPSIGFPSGGVNFGNLRNCQIDSNTFIDCSGAAYTDTGSTDGLSVTNNTVIRGQLGVGLVAAGQLKENIEISGNNFSIQNRRIGGASYGIAIGFGPSANVTINSNTITFDISGGGLHDFWGIQGTGFNGATVSNNHIGFVPYGFNLANMATGIDVTLFNNTWPDGSPVAGLDLFNH